MIKHIRVRVGTYHIRFAHFCSHAGWRSFGRAFGGSKGSLWEVWGGLAGVLDGNLGSFMDAWGPRGSEGQGTIRVCKSIEGKGPRPQQIF